MSEVRPGFVYLIGPAQELAIPMPIKVGIAHNPQKRLYDMQVGSPLALKIYHTWKYPNIGKARRAEFTFHARYDTKKSHGEWFHLSPDDAKEKLEAIYLEYFPKHGDGDTGDAKSILGAAAYYRTAEAISVSAMPRRLRARGRPNPLSVTGGPVVHRSAKPHDYDRN